MIKRKEINNACNRDFLSALNDSDKVLDYFQGKVRFELNINSMEAIRKYLNIFKTNKTTLSNVLESTANPILEFIENVIQDDGQVVNCSSLTERKNLAFLKDCDWDIKKVEEEIRTYASKGTHISQTLKPYRQLLDKLSNDGQSLRIKSKLCTLLAEILVIVVCFSPRPLLVSFSPIVALAKHLTIAYVCRSVLRPSRNVVGIHFIQFVDSCADGIVT